MDAIQKLRAFREDCVRDPEAIRDLWTQLPKFEGKLSVEEKWTVIEQFCLAAIDLHDSNIANACLKRLKQQFPGSRRVELLNIMTVHEMQGKPPYQEAISRYNELIEEDETNTSARKRKIAILKSQRMNVEAIKELCDYLKKFMNDQDAWKELCELYMIEQDYTKAIFCMEELLLSHPMSHIYHTRLAELYYTQGGHESLDTARSYYHRAVKLNDSNVRALHGLHLTLKHLLAGNRLTSNQRKDYEKLDTWTKARISKVYSGDDDDNIKNINPNVAKFMNVD